MDNITCKQAERYCSTNLEGSSEHVPSKIRSIFYIKFPEIDVLCEHQAQLLCITHYYGGLGVHEQPVKAIAGLQYYLLLFLITP